MQWHCRFLGNDKIGGGHNVNSCQHKPFIFFYPYVGATGMFLQTNLLSCQIVIICSYFPLIFFSLDFFQAPSVGGLYPSAVGLKQGLYFFPLLNLSLGVKKYFFHFETTNDVFKNFIFRPELYSSRL